MNILLITPLYPGYYNQSRIDATYAVHHIAREWAKNNFIKVLRPWTFFPKMLSFLHQNKQIYRYNFKDSFYLDGVEVIRLPIMKLPKIDYLDFEINRVAKGFIRTLNKSEYPDVIICHTLSPSVYLGSIIAENCDSKLVACLHNTDIKYLSKKRNNRRYMRVDNNVKGIGYRSKRIEKEFDCLYRGNKNTRERFLMPFGVNEHDIISENELMEKIINPRKEILVVSSLIRKKNVDVLIKAFAGLENRDNYVLSIIGEGPERANLEKIVRELDVKDFVKFKGEMSREDTLDAMRNANIFAMVSAPETLGLVYLEAMAKGCITIGSKGEGIDGIIINNYNGFLCKPRVISEFRSVLRDAVLLNREERANMLYNARNSVLKLTYEYLSIEYLKQVNQS